MNKIITKAIIPVAGFGTRFLPATKVQSKEMLPLVDKPIVEFLVEEAVEAGITDILFVTHPTRSNVDKHFSHDKNFENFLRKNGKNDLLKKIKHLHKQANFTYIHQNEPLGNGDAFLRGKEFVGNEPFAAFYADDVIISKKEPALKQLINIYNKYRAPVMGLIEINKKETDNYGVIDGRKISERTYIVNSVVEKPTPKQAPSNLASIGRFILTPDIFKYIEQMKPKNGEVYLSESLGVAAKEGTIYGHKIDGIWYDCGNKFGFWKANLELGLVHEEIGEQAKEYLKNLKSRG